MPKKKTVSIKPSTVNQQILSKKELLFFIHYLIAGVVLGIILLFKIPFLVTLDKFYGVIYMFIPGLFIFRAIFINKTFKTPLENYGYPFLISWGLHSLLIAGISGFFKVPITNFNLYGTSFVIMLIFVGVFYFRKAK